MKLSKIESIVERQLAKMQMEDYEEPRFQYSVGVETKSRGELDPFTVESHKRGDDANVKRQSESYFKRMFGSDFVRVSSVTSINGIKTDRPEFRI
jgi:hypothetical protein